MLRLYNQTPVSSEVTGWGVFATPSKDKSKKNYHIALRGTDKGIRLPIDRYKYEELTIVDSGMVFPDINKFTKLYSVCIGENKYIPVVTLAENEEEDRNILMYNYETGPGEVLTDVQLFNMQVITSYITNKDFRTRITIAAIDINNKEDFGIQIKYGFNNGRILQVEKIMFTSYHTIKETSKKYGNNKQVEYFYIDTSHEHATEPISKKNIEVPRIDLSEICIN